MNDVVTYVESTHQHQITLLERMSSDVHSCSSLRDNVSLSIPTFLLYGVPRFGLLLCSQIASRRIRKHSTALALKQVSRSYTT